MQHFASVSAYGFDFDCVEVNGTGRSEQATNLNDDDEALFDLLALWNSDDSFADRVDAVIDRLTVQYDPSATNTLHGGAGDDRIFADLDDLLEGNLRRMALV